MSSKTPLVSIVITCYNYAEYVGGAIESALEQTYKNKEVIVINDGSTDDSESVIEKYSEKTTIVSRANKGIVKTRNEGLNKAKGKYVLFLDADNTLTKNYVEQLVDCAEHEEADVVYTDMQRFGESTTRSNFPNFQVELLKTFNYIDINSLIKVTTAKRQRFDTGLEKLTHEDWDFFLGLALSGAKIVKLNNVTFNYRVHKLGISRNANKSLNREKYLEMVNFIFNKYAGKYQDFVPNYTDFVHSCLGRLESSKIENQRLEARKKENEAEISRVYNSRSWKITRPLRWVNALIRKS